MSLDQTCVSQNAEMMGGMGLRALQFLHKIRHHFSPTSNDSKSQPRFGTDGLEDRGALTRSQHLVLKGSSAATSLVGRAGDSVTADALARAVDDREMRSVAVGFQYF